MFNFYLHLRLIGCVVMIAGEILNNIAVTLIGLVIVFMGTVGAVDKLERQVKKLEHALHLDN
jgi:hypothetical protein